MNTTACFSKSVDELSKKYIQLKADVEALISEINLLPEGLNTQSITEKPTHCTNTHPNALIQLFHSILM